MKRTASGLAATLVAMLVPAQTAMLAAVLAAILASCSLTSTAAGQTAAPPPAIAQIASYPPVVTHHVGTFNGRLIRYLATVEAIDVPGPSGKPAASLVSFAYTADDLPAASRPVMFVFNGGPITASLWLHIGVMGPKRVAVPEDLTANPDTYRLVDNIYSPLDVADLVFIDPASTGYSRVLPGTAPESYFSVVADAQQVTAFINAWLTQHSRLTSRTYLLGESYGTIRSAEVAGQLAELPHPILLQGVVLMGQAINIIEYRQRPQNVVSFAVSLPTLAALAWYHQKVDRKRESLEQFVNDAWRFAETDYLTALFKGSELDPAERDRIAKRLEEFSGIPASYYRDHELRISKEQYRGELLKDRGLLLGRNDGRYVAPIGKKGLADDPSSVIMAPFQRLFGDYIRNDLKVDRAESYIPMATSENLDGWKWGGSGPFADWPYSDRLLKVMRANPHFHVLIGNGYHDTQTTVGAAEYAVRQAGWPEGRATLKYYEGGHMAYTVERSAKKFTDDIRTLIQSTQ
jgi:carboxypeptidase C (cathepsin A)